MCSLKKHLVKIAIAVSCTPVILLASTIYTEHTNKDTQQEILGLETPELTEQEQNTASTTEPEPLCVIEEVIEVAYADPEGKIQENIGYQNNKLGLYVYAEVLDFSIKAAEIVNSNGGDWGYVLIPFSIHDRNEGRWGRLFGLLENKHLIPIVQLWDLQEGDGEDITTSAARFLDSFIWPIRPRYISVYNEPNDDRFWREELDPKDYARILDSTIDIFKERNQNFFMLNGAFNASALTGYGYMDEEEFMQKMDKEVSGIFEKLDGWASHSYPQPNFSGGVGDSGRNSIRAYEWELELLEKHFGVKNLPVFITETGWAHAEGETFNKWYKEAEEAAELLVEAFDKVWLPDDRVVAVTPFTIRYNPPHDHFSWITADNKDYPQVEKIQKINKVEGKPPVREERVVQVYKCFEE